jgi:hypothetical protein
MLPAHEQHRTEVLNILCALTSLEGFRTTAGPAAQSPKQRP